MLSNGSGSSPSLSRSLTPSPPPNPPPQKKKTSMGNYWIKTVAQLKEFVKQNNIQMGEPSGKYGRLIKTDYLAAIKN